MTTGETPGVSPASAVEVANSPSGSDAASILKYLIVMSISPLKLLGCSHLGYRIAVLVCYPDIDSIKSHRLGQRPHTESSQVRAVVGADFGHAIVVGIRHPD